MSELAEKFRKAMAAMMRAHKTIACEGAVCKSVTGQTCTIVMDDLEVEGILLGIDKQGVIIYPAANSNVLVLFSDDTKTNGLVVFADQVDKVEIMGNINGGIALTDAIAQRIGRLESAFFNLQTKFNTHVHSGVTTGPGSSGITSIISSEVVTPVTTQSDISSTKTLHGNG